MLTLSNRNQILVGIALVAILAVTRNHHFATMLHLPGASWAVFFLAGVYLRPKWILGGLFATTWFLDFAAFKWGGASGFCLTPAYGFLIPAYAALWFGGRWYAGQHKDEIRTLFTLLIAAVGSAFICELFSSGGFYFFSGRFAETTVVEFFAREMNYFPMYLQSLMFYVGIAAVIHSAFAATKQTAQQHITSSK